MRVSGAIVLLLAAGCGGEVTVAADDTGPAAPWECGPGLQRGAPWPTLWRCNDHRARSPFVGPRAPKVKWVFDAGFDGYSSTLIGADGTLYFLHVAGNGATSKLYALRPNGTQKWMTDRTIETLGAIAADGSLYAASRDHLYAINPDGSVKRAIALTGLTAAPVIGADGTIYVASNGHPMPIDQLYALSADGSTKWAFPTEDAIQAIPTVDAHGTIYLSALFNFLYHRLYALSPEGASRWTFTTGEAEVFSTPSLAEDGTIYFGTGKSRLIAVRPDGQQRWAVTVSSPGMALTPPAIGPDGSLYVSSAGAVHAFDAGGAKKWEYGILCGPPVLDAEGTIYTPCGPEKTARLDAVRPDGSQKWSLALPGWIDYELVIGADGTIYLGCAKKSLCAVGA